MYLIPFFIIGISICICSADVQKIRYKHSSVNNILFMKPIDWINNVFHNNIYDMKEYIKKSLALKIKALRESHGLTQEDLAAQCNVSWRTISNLERGLVVPDVVMLVRMSEIFNATLDDLLSLNVDSDKSKSRLNREQFIIEKIRTLNDKSLDFLLDELLLIFKHFN